ncbi:LysE/ArgO family amino acid transporter [Salipiger mucosus]|uniref:Transporter, LysE family n=1 Tax=Salipiger mucosus DSM 16094 TaxID=1123237 RepID=S9Q4M7_9RHOB|nr:LysE/ArgO family amino acid transporter [Salipiger mucosus]EPX76301.1 Transporter, LysE family [Salipiger mucosus DSM 16094]
MQSAIAGFALGLSLILAIGSQNAFVLRQGLRREHVGTVVAICALSDAALIAAGVSGFGALTRSVPGLEWAMRLLGVAFLGWYGARTLGAAWRGGDRLEAGAAAGSRRAAVLTCLAFTWLNPHVYLDTVVLLGAVSSQYADRTWFALGAMSASLCFFTALGYGARALAPLFARPGAWRALDLLVGLTMWAIAAKLLLG